MAQNAERPGGRTGPLRDRNWRATNRSITSPSKAVERPEIVSVAPADTEALSALVLPRRARGRATAAAAERYHIEVEDFCDAILEIRSRLDFEISARGWAYILETEAGLAKGDFDEAEKLIAACRKDGRLPVDIVAEDTARQFDNLDGWIDDDDPAAEAAAIIARAKSAHLDYRPFSFWRDQPVYLEMLVEKVDLRSLFGPVCAEFSHRDRQRPRLVRHPQPRGHDGPVQALGRTWQEMRPPLLRRPRPHGPEHLDVLAVEHGRPRRRGRLAAR